MGGWVGGVRGVRAWVKHFLCDITRGQRRVKCSKRLTNLYKSCQKDTQTCLIFSTIGLTQTVRMFNVIATEGYDWMETDEQSKEGGRIGGSKSENEPTAAT